MTAQAQDTFTTARPARRARYAATGRLGPGPGWCWLTPLTPRPIARTTRIMTGLLSPMRYAQVVCRTAPLARPVVTRAVARLPPGDQPRVVVRELPAAAFAPEPQR